MPNPYLPAQGSSNCVRVCGRGRGRRGGGGLGGRGGEGEGDDNEQTETCNDEIVQKVLNQSSTAY